jgi:heptosyltransferase-2
LIFIFVNFDDDAVSLLDWLGPLADESRVVEHPTLPCRPCHPHGPARCPQRHFRCMREIDAAQVLETLAPLLRRA